jgi:hypothetical protein
MYTKLDDQRQAKLIKAYMQSHPNCNIKDIIQGCVTARSRLAYLEKQGYFRLPKQIDNYRFTDTLIQNINTFINSNECTSHRTIRKKFKVGYDTLKNLEWNKLIKLENKYGLARKSN